MLVKHDEAPTEHKHPVLFAEDPRQGGGGDGASGASGAPSILPAAEAEAKLRARLRSRHRDDDEINETIEAIQRDPERFKDHAERGAFARSLLAKQANKRKPAETPQVLKLNHITSELHERYPSWEATNLTFEYPDMKPGQCILMHRSQLHASDGRKSFATNTRKSFTLRFIVLPQPAAPLDIWLGNGYAKRYLMPSKRAPAGAEPPCKLNQWLPGWCTIHAPAFSTFLEHA